MTVVLTVANRAWTQLPGTDIEIFQSSGGALQIVTDSVDGGWALTLGNWHVRSATPIVDADDPHYQEGQAAVRNLLDIGAHTANTILSVLSRVEQTMVTAHYHKQNVRYAQAKGMADAIREYLEAL